MQNLTDTGDVKPKKKEPEIHEETPINQPENKSPGKFPTSGIKNDEEAEAASLLSTLSDFDMSDIEPLSAVELPSDITDENYGYDPDQSFWPGLKSSRFRSTFTEKHTTDNRPGKSNPSSSSLKNRKGKPIDEHLRQYLEPSALPLGAGAPPKKGSLGGVNENEIRSCSSGDSEIGLGNRASSALDSSYSPMSAMNLGQLFEEEPEFKTSSSSSGSENEDANNRDLKIRKKTHKKTSSRKDKDKQTRIPVEKVEGIVDVCPEGSLPLEEEDFKKANVEDGTRISVGRDEVKSVSESGHVSPQDSLPKNDTPIDLAKETKPRRLRFMHFYNYFGDVRPVPVNEAGKIQEDLMSEMHTGNNDHKKKRGKVTSFFHSVGRRLKTKF